MKKLLAALPLVFILLLAGCGGGDILTGQWVDDAENIYVFGNNGTLQIGRNDAANQTALGAMSCTYELTPDNEDDKSTTGKIKLIITPQEGKKTETTGTYKLEAENTKLTITGDDGSKSELTKSQ